jgi:methylated-DNA-protein-cysteine methyltransferase-like protein
MVHLRRRPASRGNSNEEIGLVASNDYSYNRALKKIPMKWNPIYALVKKIPRGHVMTYGQIAKFLRVRGGARTAGHAMAASPSGEGVPWHRVVGAGGKLLIQEPHASLQRKLLESEGLRLAEKRILNFKDYVWSPGKARGRGSRRKSTAVKKIR